ncbi:hypothetical protein HY68_36575 [Streptomyces sp. AcH 505]|nr:hypothetical protein HY68_36575 [Streptomyces sp. AcH 505]
MAQGLALAAKYRAVERRGHHPYQDTAWDRSDETTRSGARPDGWERAPWCGGEECDEVTRTYQVEVERGIKALRRCQKCHPALRF